MSPFAGLIDRLRSLFLRKRVESELDEELRFHLEHQIEANIEKGMSPAEARTTALRSLGGIDQTKEACRDERGVRLLEDLGQDLLYGLRILRKTPGFTAVAVLTLALGIGANTAVFSVVDGVLLSRLDYPDSDRIVTLWNTYPAFGEGLDPVSPPDFWDWREENRSFDHLAAYDRFFYILAGAPAPVRLRSARVSGDFFAAIGVNPILGRPILPADDHEGSDHVVVLGHRLWTSRFGADPEVVGRTVILNGIKRTVVGIMPEGFDFPYEAKLWTPLAYEPPFEPGLRRIVWFQTVARLKQGVTLAQARADISSIAGRLAEEFPDTNEGRDVAIVSLKEATVGEVRPALLVLLGAVGFVLLIACANLVNLLLSRGAGRSHEIALRAAMGAGRPRLIRQLVAESLLLGLMGGVGGLMVAHLFLDLLRRFNPGSVPRLEEVALDLRVLGFAFLVSLVAGVASGIAPALMATQADPYTALKEGGSRASDGLRRRRFRSSLVVVEVALAQVLLVGGCLLFQSFLRMSSVNPGFDPDGLLVTRFELASDRYRARSARAAFYRESVERVAALPGIQTAALSSTVPLSEGQLSLGFEIEGRPPPPSDADSPGAGFDTITPDYFRTMGIRLKSGRFFTDADSEDATRVTIINEAMAQRYWPGEDPLGHRIRLHTESSTPSDPLEIVGVVENVRQMAMADEGRPEFYMPYLQYPWTQCYLLMRTEVRPSTLVAAVRHEISEIDEEIALSEFRSMRRYISASLDSPRFNAFLLGIFATLALTLATGGVFGVVSYTTSQRTRGFAIRMALGAQRGDIFRLVVGGGFLPVLAGIGLGLVLALALTQALSSMLFEIVPTDPVTYGVVGILLSLVALAACYFPSRQAMKVDPAIALRQD